MKSGLGFPYIHVQCTHYFTFSSYKIVIKSWSTFQVNVVVSELTSLQHCSLFQIVAKFSCLMHGSFFFLAYCINKQNQPEVVCLQVLQLHLFAGTCT